MALYSYECFECGLQDVMKPMSEASREEFCEICNNKMNRVYTVPNWSIPGIEFTHMNDLETYGAYEHKKATEKQFRENKAKGLEVDKVTIPKGLPKSLQPELK